MNYTAAIRALLREHGKMTAHELLGLMPGAQRSHINATLHRLRAQREVYISVWVRDDQDGVRLYPRAVYRLGDHHDAKRLPRLSTTERNARRPASIAVQARRNGVPNSVFQLARLT